MLRKLGLPSVTPRVELYKAILVHICLAQHPKYKPVLLKTAEETTDYILTQANLLMPGYEIVSDEGHQWESMLNDLDLAKVIDENYFHLRRPTDELFYCNSPEELTMEWKGIHNWKGTPEYDIIREALMLLIHMGVNDVKDNNPYDCSDEALYGKGFDQYESFVEQIESDIEDDIKKEFACSSDKIDEKALAKEISKRALAIIRKERDLRKKVVLPMYKKRPVDLLKLYKAAKRKDDLGRWVSHLLMMHENKFLFGQHIVLNQDEEYYPIKPDCCIGILYDRDQYCYKYHFSDIESSANNYGYMPIGDYEYLSPSNGYHKPESKPVISWLRIALSFDISTLTYA